MRKIRQGTLVAANNRLLFLSPPTFQLLLTANLIGQALEFL